METERRSHVFAASVMQQSLEKNKREFRKNLPIFSFSFHMLFFLFCPTPLPEDQGAHAVTL